jgi:hypothetical protein
MTLQEKFEFEVKNPSDINQHLISLKNCADACEHVTEMGVRTVVSSYAFLTSKAKTVIGYDIAKHPNVDECLERCKAEGREWKFIEADVLKVEIEPTDFLFIDTFHTASQLKRELELHAGKVKRFIGFHDTTTYWEKGEDSYESVAHNAMNCGRGLRHAIEPFLKANPEWKIVFRAIYNNGLMIIERK